jgi:hypothetical protein
MHTSRMTAAAMALVLIAATAWADQAAYISKDQAEEALKLVPLGGTIRHYCEPCGDTAWTEEAVSEKSVRHTGYESYYEVLVNGEGVDLAYVYVLAGETWMNLALHMGLPVRDVSETLPDLPDEEAGAPEAYYAGTIGEGLRVLMRLERHGDGLFGDYWYAHVGKPIYVEGTSLRRGALTMTESVDGAKTGVFNGHIRDGGARIEGAWHSPDGSRTLPFELHRFGEVKEESIDRMVAGVRLLGLLAYPSFTLDEPAAQEALNALVRRRVTTPYEAFAKDLEGFLQREPDETPAAELYPHGLEFEIAGPVVTHFSPGLVSLVLSRYEYAGGAHPNSGFVTITARIEGGRVRELTLAGLFKPDAPFLDTLSPLLLDDLKRQEAAFVVDGTVAELGPDDLDLFTVSRKGITFYFQPYAVGPYVQGPFESAVSWDALSGLVNRDLLESANLEP